MLVQECPDFAPAVHCLFLSIVGRMVIEEAVAGAVVPMEFYVLAGRYQEVGSRAASSVASETRKSAASSRACAVKPIISEEGKGQGWDES